MTARRPGQSSLAYTAASSSTRDSSTTSPPISRARTINTRSPSRPTMPSTSAAADFAPGFRSPVRKWFKCSRSSMVRTNRTATAANSSGACFRTTASTWPTTRWRPPESGRNGRSTSLWYSRFSIFRCRKTSSSISCVARTIRLISIRPRSTTTRPRCDRLPSLASFRGGPGRWRCRVRYGRRTRFTTRTSRWFSTMFRSSVVIKDVSIRYSATPAISILNAILNTSPGCIVRRMPIVNRSQRCLLKANSGRLPPSGSLPTSTGGIMPTWTHRARLSKQSWLR